VEAHPNAKGEFSFRLGFTNNSVTMSAEETRQTSARPAGTMNLPALGTSMQMSQNPLGDCVVRAILVGYNSDVIRLAGRSAADSPDIGTIVLHPAGKGGSATVSAMSLAAPKNALKAFQKGSDEVKDRKPQDALKSFQEAVKLYPAYAEAYYEMGRVQADLNQADAARASFDAAVKADPKYAPPYMTIAQMEEKSRNWKAVSDITAQLLAIDPSGYPAAYLYNSVANLNLKNTDAAEKSAREGLKADTQHASPKLWQVLGVILANRGAFPEAIEQFQAYLKFAPNGPDAAAVQSQLAQCQKLAAGGGAAPAKQ
jgi:tetratricopeptide (TPR) repeat protein